MGQRLAQAREWAAVAVSARARVVGEVALVEWALAALVEEMLALGVLAVGGESVQVAGVEAQAARAVVEVSV